MIEPNILIHHLNQLGVHFLVDDGYHEAETSLSIAELLAGLASQSDARLRLSLIAVLLQFPSFGQEAKNALKILDESKRPIFMLYYTAAYYLQRIYRTPLREFMGHFTQLPDLYSEKLEIAKTGPAKEQLKQLAKRHQDITGLHLNWYGTYHHAAKRVITRLKVERSWDIA